MAQAVNIVPANTGHLAMAVVIMEPRLTNRHMNPITGARAATLRAKPEDAQEVVLRLKKKQKTKKVKKESPALKAAKKKAEQERQHLKQNLIQALNVHLIKSIQALIKWLTLSTAAN